MVVLTVSKICMSYQITSPHHHGNSMPFSPTSSYHGLILLIYNDIPDPRASGSSYLISAAARSIFFSASKSQNTQLIAAAAAAALQLFNEILTRGDYQSKVEQDLINHRPDLIRLASAVTAFKPMDMQQVADFVNHWQQQLLDQLYDERAVLKQIPDWPAVKWEALWEAAVMYSQLTDLQEQCFAAAAAAAAGSSSSLSGLRNCITSAQQAAAGINWRCKRDLLSAL